MKNNLIKTGSFLLSCIMLFSCYSTYPIYKGNVHQEAIGKTKIDILKSYGVPSKTIDDGAGGMVLSFEKESLVTYSTGVTRSNYNLYANRGAVYTSGGINNASTTNSTTVSAVNVQYCHIYLDSNNVATDFRTNYGAIYDHQKCFSKLQARSNAAIFSLVTIGFGTPIAFLGYHIALSRAKQGGIPICEDAIKTNK
jgi:hypothetical protein